MKIRILLLCFVAAITSQCFADRDDDINDAAKKLVQQIDQQKADDDATKQRIAENTPENLEKKGNGLFACLVVTVGIVFFIVYKFANMPKVEKYVPPSRVKTAKEIEAESIRITIIIAIIAAIIIEAIYCLTKNQ
jgi:hypothetical protein